MSHKMSAEMSEFDKKRLALSREASKMNGTIMSGFMWQISKYHPSIRMKTVGLEHLSWVPPELIYKADVIRVLSNNRRKSKILKDREAVIAN